MKKTKMKKITSTLIALLFALHSPAVQAEDKPAISIHQAADLAEKAKALRENGDTVFIESLTLQRTGIFAGKTVWIAKWSGKLPANNPRDREVGVEISMDGTVKHIVKGPADK